MYKSVIEYYSENEKHKCGYCKQSDTSCTRGMWAHTLTVQDYQSLIDRGWRRSGQYCYKPIMDDTCCPMYTIRCDALDFKLTKSQKKLLKKFSKYVTTDIGENKNNSNECKEDTAADKNRECPSSSQECAEVNDDFLMQMSNKKHKKVDISAISTSLPRDVAIPNASKTKTEDVANSGDGNSIPCKKAKQIRIERKKEKLLKKGVEWNPQTKKSSQNNAEKSLEDYFDFFNTLSNFKIKLVRCSPPSPEWLSTSSKTHELYMKYQTAIHNEPPDKCTEYQYRRFLVKSPLQANTLDGNLPMKYGSFHQQYWLGNELIAVGVIDILPSCVSSVYFYYDPKYSHLSLGTFGALQEIAFTRSLHKVAPRIKYYYLGYYIHSCQKMRYKGNYAPSFLLCPETYEWFPIEECRPKIDVSPYSRLTPNLDQTDEDSCDEKDINDMLILLGNNYAKFSQYKPKLQLGDNSLFHDVENTLLQYGRLVGRNCSQSMLYVLQ